MKVKNVPEFKEWKTERQWAKAGYLPKKGEEGVEMWSNRECRHHYRYYPPEAVEKATAEQLQAFFRPEKDRNNVRQRRWREKKRIEREKERAEEECRKIDELIAPYRAEIAKLREIIKTLSIETRRSDSSIAPSETLVIDLETTGLSPYSDEILQLSIIDGSGKVLFDSYFKPFARSWNEAQRVNGISPDMVKDAPMIYQRFTEISNILDRAEKVIGYNIENFDLAFMRHAGFRLPQNAAIVDVMHLFAVEYGEWSEYHGDFKWQKLTRAAAYYGYDWTSHENGAHNSLADCFATLYVYNKLMEGAAENG